MPDSRRFRSTREAILALLRAGPRTAGDLAGAVGVSPQAVRDHLRTLEARGWIEPGTLRRDTGGKPAREYVLSTEGEKAFEKSHADVLRYLVRELGARLGDRRKRELLDAVGRRIGADRAVGGERAVAAPGELGADELPRRLERAARVLNEIGGAATVEETEGGPRIRSAGCPLSSLVRDDPDVCLLAAALVETIAGVEVHDTCDRSDRPRCRFELGPAG